MFAIGVFVGFTIAQADMVRHVQVVHLDHRGLGDELVPEGVRVDVRGRGLQEDAAGLTQQPVFRLGHEGDDHERGDGVGAVEAGQHDDQRGNGGADEGEQVVEDVLVGALDVERGTVGLGEAPGGGHVHHDPGERGAEHQSALDIGRADEPAHRLVRRPRPQQEQRELSTQRKARGQWCARSPTPSSKNAAEPPATTRPSS